MVREGEESIMRSVQLWMVAQAKAEIDFAAQGVHFIAEDEGDFESEVDKKVTRGDLTVLFTTPGLRKIDHAHRQVIVQLKVFESVKLHRGTSRVVHWTALRIAERMLALFDGNFMASNPFPFFYAEGDSLQLVSQVPWLVYDVNMVGKMILGRQTS